MLAAMVRTLVLASALAACGDPPRAVDSDGGAPDPASGCDAWHQWGSSASHGGASCVRGQPLHTMLSEMVYDPFLAQEVADGRGDLFVHYQAPLIDGDDLYMMAKKGTYTPCDTGSNGPSCNNP